MVEEVASSGGMMPELARAAVGTAARFKLVARNAFVTLYSVRLPAGTIGIDIKFRNETEELARIEVSAVRGSIASSGVMEGDATNSRIHLRPRLGARPPR